MFKKIDEKKAVILYQANASLSVPPYFRIHYHLHLYCNKGSMHFVFNKQQYHCRQGEFAFWLAEQSIEFLTFSADFNATILLISRTLVLENTPSVNRKIKSILYAKEYPILHPSAQDEKRIISSFKTLYAKSLDTTHHFYQEVLNLHMQLFLLEMWHIFEGELGKQESNFQSGTHYIRFIELVEKHCITQRSVQFYSDRLCITAKHLNHICTVNTGITASEWIKRYTEDLITKLLNDKTLTISEIADKMEFSSRSFFTRYVKKLLGLTPSQYRKRF
ncbi:AraC family transcriptional regulator [Myroides sp. NP-2]|uniref:helix-turn-helix domain-containing protein n=1 Tax=Myroides sp. NP-2 TaxID=2759945 RepID=UPI0015FA9A51|nr:helix-turn-helix domain-containing protein [Myroides sp. NP-2]MBB1149889.1 AraC family transcriptional regulator [Myroides sp. NP-2]